MKIQVHVGAEWRNAEATIDRAGNAIVLLPNPYGTKLFKPKQWRRLRMKQNGVKRSGILRRDAAKGGK